MQNLLSVKSPAAVLLQDLDVQQLIQSLMKLTRLHHVVSSKSAIDFLCKSDLDTPLICSH